MLSKGLISRFAGIVISLCVLLDCGCSTVSPVSSRYGNREELDESIHTMANAIAGREVSEEDVNRIKRDIITNKDARTAVNSIAESLTGSGIKVKYCPVDGERFSARLDKCPVHNVELKILDE